MEIHEFYLRDWERFFPGKGAALMDVLRPFYYWKPELKPALQDLEERAKETIFWREIEGVKVCKLSHWDSLREPHPWGSFTNSLVILAGASLEPKVKRRHSLLHSLDVSLKDLLWDSHKITFGDSFWDLLVDLHCSSVWNSVFLSLYYPCGFVLVDEPEEAAKFKPLLDLWPAGNFPVGFDEDDNLLVLVAD